MKEPRLSTHVKLGAPALVGLVAVVAGLALAGCGGTSTSTSATVGGATEPTATTSGDSTAIPSTGPRPAPIIYRPPGLSQARPVPLLLALHPSGGSPQGFLRTTRFDFVADAHGFVVVYLATLPPASPAWRQVDLPRNLAYISSEIKRVIREQNIDPRRVYVTGFSAGATMTYVVACTLSSQVDGIAAVSGAILRDYPCHVTHPLSELEIIGTHDLIPIDGSEVLMSVDQIAARFRDLDGCSSAPASVAVVGSARTQSWGRCQNNTGVELGVIPGGEHYYPGQAYGPGPDTNFPASEGIWAFFMSHPGG